VRTFLASVSFAALTLMAPLAANAAFTVKIFAAPNDTGSDVTFGALLNEFESDYIGFFSNQDNSDVAGWPLASQQFGAEITGFL
jgi:hypothetical protein